MRTAAETFRVSDWTLNRMDPDGLRYAASVWVWVHWFMVATGNLGLGSKALVQERVNNFRGGLASRREEVKRRCRATLQSRADGLRRNSPPNSPRPANAHPTWALV